MNEEEWMEIKPHSGKIRKETLNRIFRWWLEDFGVLTPKQGEHIRRAMGLAIFDQRVLKKSQFKEKPDIYRGMEESTI